MDEEKFLKGKSPEEVLNYALECLNKCEELDKQINKLNKEKSFNFACFVDAFNRYAGKILKKE